MKTAHHRFAVAILALLVLPVPAWGAVEDEDPIKAELDAAGKVYAVAQGTARTNFEKAYVAQLKAFNDDIKRVAATGDLDGVKSIQARIEKLKNHWAYAAIEERSLQRGRHRLGASLLWKYQLAYFERSIEAKMVYAAALDLAVRKFTMRLEFDRATELQTAWKETLEDIKSQRLLAAPGLYGTATIQKLGGFADKTRGEVKDDQILRVTYTNDADIARGTVHLKEIGLPVRLLLRADIGGGIDSITDSGMVHLKELTNLREIYLTDTKVTDSGLVHLKKLINLHDLSFHGTCKVTAAGLKKLQQALPNCDIRP